MLWGSKRKNQPPFISASRHAVVREKTHYGFQSAQAHARMAAVSIAILVDQPEEQWNPGHGESSIVVTALLCLACIISEIEVAGGYDHHPKLAELWSYLRDLDEEAKDVWALRYPNLPALDLAAARAGKGTVRALREWLAAAQVETKQPVETVKENVFNRVTAKDIVSPAYASVMVGLAAHIG
jgi:hypothetical protein